MLELPPSIRPRPQVGHGVKPPKETLYNETMAESGFLAPRAARSSAQARGGPLARPLAQIAELFEAAPPRARIGALELAAVALIVAAGAALRFWGLGAVGLHGDEKTMALPLMHLIREGSPLFPSGMYYARDLGQLYLMAASVHVFGASAWAMRLPSALCGVLLIALTPLAGRGFLTMPWNLALTATVAFLPSFIEDAQTARMYVFLVTCVAAYIVLLLEWERTGRTRWLVAASIALVIGIQFHQLAVFGAFLVLYPGLLRADGRRLALGIAAFAAIAVSFFLMSHWIDSYFPDTAIVASGPRAAAVIRPSAGVLGVGAAIAALLGTLVGSALARFGRTLARSAAAVPAGIAGGVLCGLALFAQLAPAYHVAAILYVAAIIIVTRSMTPGPDLPGGRGPESRGRLGRPAHAVALAAFALGLTALLLLAAQLAVLARHGVSAQQAAGALLGWPSVWPLAAVGRYSPVSIVVLGAGIVLGGARLARRRPAPDFLLFFALGVWVPLLMIGAFKWDIPPRYAAAEIFPLLIGAFAAAQWLWGEAAARRLSVLRWQVPVAALVGLLAVNPASLARTAGSGYGDHPDHLGAARFVRAHLRPGDIVIAEDVIMQTYYLGHVDYWLVGKQNASAYIYRHDGRLEDFYTNTPVLTTAQALERLIAQRDRGAIYIVGSGEQQEDGRAFARGASLERFLTSPDLPVVYVGRDGLTKVWRIPPPPSGPAGRS